MKNSVFLLLCVLLFSSTPFSDLQASQGDENALAIVIDNGKKEDNNKQVIFYPKGSQFLLKTQNGNEMASSKDENKKHTYWGLFDLIVYPTYRQNEADLIKIKYQRVRIFTSQTELEKEGLMDYKEIKPTKNNSVEIHQAATTSNGLTMKKIITPSTKNPRLYNAHLIFSNGLNFYYEDGKKRAEKNGKYVNIEGKYIMKVKGGKIKLSYDPTNGTVWWVFDKK